MPVLTQFIAAFVLAIVLPTAAHAAPLVAFASEEGMARLVRSTARVDFAPLANQFEAQSNIAFCGPTTAAIVINTLRPNDVETPLDHNRLLPEDGRHLAPGRELALPRHTQESVIARGQKTRAQVFGEPVVVNGRSQRDGGYQLRQLDELLRAHQLATRLVIADHKISDEEIRRDLLDNLQRPDDYVIVNYQRSAIGQAGGGHISPLAAYDADSDSVLVLDVNPALHGWVWMPLATLIQGMRTADAQENRGYILLRNR